MMESIPLTSNRQDWETPQNLFDDLNEEFSFDIDACANVDNHKCSQYWSEEEDALEQDWSRYSAVWMNPPFGRGVDRWIEKAYKESLRGVTVVCLVPSRTDTRWWHDYCMKGEIRFIKGRLHFSNAKHNAPFPCAIVIFRGHMEVAE